MQKITSKDNARLKRVRSLLRSKKDRQNASCFVMEGVRALHAWVDGSALPSFSLTEIWVSDAAEALAESFDVPVYSIPAAWMEQISDCRSSQGILGVIAVDPAPLEIADECGNYLLLDRVMDPGNMGTLIRSAVAFGFKGVLLSGDCVDVYNPKTVRSSMGALPFCAIQQIHAEGPLSIAGLREKGYQLIVTAMSGSVSLKDVQFGAKNVLVIGNEANGVSDEIMQQADLRLSIPMADTVESLNAGVAGSLCMFAMA